MLLIALYLSKHDTKIIQEYFLRETESRSLLMGTVQCRFSLSMDSQWFLLILLLAWALGSDISELKGQSYVGRNTIGTVNILFYFAVYKGCHCVMLGGLQPFR